MFQNLGISGVFLCFSVFSSGVGVGELKAACYVAYPSLYFCSSFSCIFSYCIFGLNVLHIFSFNISDLKSIYVIHIFLGSLTTT